MSGCMSLISAYVFYFSVFIEMFEKFVIYCDWKLP